MRRQQIPVQLHLIHWILTLSPAIFVGTIYFLNQINPEPSEIQQAQSTIFEMVGAVLAVVAVGFSQLVPRFMAKQTKNFTLQKYTTMKIIQWAFIEGASTLVVVIFYLTNQPNLLIPIGILIALLALLRPTTEEMERYGVKESP